MSRWFIEWRKCTGRVGGSVGCSYGLVGLGIEG